MEPNVREALETELTGVVARMARADDVQRVKLEARANDIRTALGVAPEVKPRVKRSATGKETRPDGAADEVR